MDKFSLLSIPCHTHPPQFGKTFTKTVLTNLSTSYFGHFPSPKPCFVRPCVRCQLSGRQPITPNSVGGGERVLLFIVDELLTLVFFKTSNSPIAGLVICFPFATPRVTHLSLVWCLWHFFPPLASIVIVANASDHLFSFAIPTTTMDKWFSTPE